MRFSLSARGAGLKAEPLPTGSVFPTGIERGGPMKKIVFIVSGGKLGDPAFLRQQAAALSPVAVICADSGALRLVEAGIVPDLIVGDMDSLSDRDLSLYEARGCRIVRHPQRKDETDTELALHEAFRMEPAEIWIWGALGYRVDHTLANISLLFQGKQRGVTIKLIDGWGELFLIDRRTVLDGKPGQTVSLFPFAGPATGITLTGFEFPLRNAAMEIGRPYGVSNRLAAESGTIDIDSGILLAVRYFRPGAFPGEATE